MAVNDLHKGRKNHVKDIQASPVEGNDLYTPERILLATLKN
jgi:hypothetical protein